MQCRSLVAVPDHGDPDRSLDGDQLLKRLEFLEPKQERVVLHQPCRVEQGPCCGRLFLAADEVGARLRAARSADAGALLARIGFHGLPIARADEARVRPSADRWGRYYDFDPIVVLGKLDDPQGRWCAASCTTADAS